MQSIYFRIVVAVVLAGATPVLCRAQGTSPSDRPGADSALTARIAELQAQVAEARSAGDNAWVLMSTALVLLMTGPGLALFYGGLVRKKNVLATMMQSFILMGVITVLWAVVGYSLAFSEGSPFIGGLKYVFLNGVGLEPNPDYAGTIPHQ